MRTIGTKCSSSSSLVVVDWLVGCDAGVRNMYRGGYYFDALFVADMRSIGDC